MRRFKRGVFIVLVAILSVAARHLWDREISTNKRIGVKNLINRIQFPRQRADKQVSEHDDDHGFLGYADSGAYRRSLYNTRRSCKSRFCKRGDIIEVYDSLKDIQNAIVVVYEDKKYIGSKKNFHNEKDLLEYVKKAVKRYKYCDCDSYEDYYDSYEDDYGSDEYYNNYSNEEYNSIEVFRPKFGNKRKHKKYYLRKGCGCGIKKRSIRLSEPELNNILSKDTVTMFIDDLREVLSKSYDDKYLKDSRSDKRMVLRCNMTVVDRCEFLTGRSDEDSIANLLRYFKSMVLINRDNEELQ